MSPERDKQTIRIVGRIAIGLGALLMVLTILVTLASLYLSAGHGNALQAAIAFGTSLVMASTMLSCGTQLQRLNLYTSDEVDTVRMSWTALLLVMIGSGLIGLWCQPSLTLPAAIMTVLLAAIRPAVIRLSGR